MPNETDNKQGGQQQQAKEKGPGGWPNKQNNSNECGKGRDNNPPNPGYNNCNVKKN